MAHQHMQAPEGAHDLARYESAKRHAELARAAGKSNEEVHAVFKSVMEFDSKTDLDKLSDEGAHGKYKTAVIHAQHAVEKGKSKEEAHALFQKIMAGQSTGCKHKAE